jgi:hypothetical protein
MNAISFSIIIPLDLWKLPSDELAVNNEANLRYGNIRIY